MIGRLSGALARRSWPAILLDVGGVGYEVQVPLSTFETLPPERSAVTLEIVTLMRNDALQLFGFADPLDKRAFEVLLGVSGIGPRLALAILSRMSVPSLADAVERDDPAPFRSVPGIGPKTARRIALELRDRLDGLALDRVPAAAQRAGGADGGIPPALRADALDALVNLGYKRDEADEALRRAVADAAASDDLAALLRGALKRLGGSKA